MIESSRVLVTQLTSQEGSWQPVKGQPQAWFSNTKINRRVRGAEDPFNRPSSSSPIESSTDAAIARPHRVVASGDDQDRLSMADFANSLTRRRFLEIRL